MKRRLSFAGKSHRGRVLDGNEDKFLIDEELGLIIVADGMENRNAGELASELAATTIWDTARERGLTAGARSELSARTRTLQALTDAANARVFAAGAQPGNSGMGTTLLAVLTDERSMSVAHIGDSCLFLYREGALRRLTPEHPESRRIGSTEAVEVDVAEHDLAAGDTIIAATDCLTRMTGEYAIAAALSQHQDLEVLVDKLIELALEAGGTENVTVAVARVHDKASAPSKADR